MVPRGWFGALVLGLAVCLGLVAWVPEGTGPQAPSPRHDARQVVDVLSLATVPHRGRDVGASNPPGAVTDEQREVAYRVQVHAAELDAAAVTARIDDILTDPRGWARAGFRFVLSSDAPIVITVAEGDEIDRRCLPYDTYGLYSCQLGPTVNLNADRWRSATPQWTADLEAYRTMLVNHEVGHLLGLHHPQPQCPGEGLPAPIMLQQSTELGACYANPWPLTWEAELAATYLEPFAPGFEPEPADRPVPPAVRR